MIFTLTLCSVLILRVTGLKVIVFSLNHGGDRRVSSDQQQSVRAMFYKFLASNNAELRPPKLSRRYSRSSSGNGGGRKRSLFCIAEKRSFLQWKHRSSDDRYSTPGIGEIQCVVSHQMSGVVNIGGTERVESSNFILNSNKVKS